MCHILYSTEVYLIENVKLDCILFQANLLGNYPSRKK
jgi:hypothetical protein